MEKVVGSSPIRCTVANYFKQQGDKMTKAIRSYPESERRSVINRRLKNNTGGIGYYSAVDAVEWAKKPKTVVKTEE